MDKFIDIAKASIAEQGLYAIMFSVIIWGLWKIYREERNDRINTHKEYKKIMDKNIDVLGEINKTITRLLDMVQDLKDMAKK